MEGSGLGVEGECQYGRGGGVCFRKNHSMYPQHPSLLTIGLNLFSKHVWENNSKIFHYELIPPD